MDNGSVRYEYELALTGERTLPGISQENYWFRRHQAAYLAAVELVKEIGYHARVLDAGCGEGYGAALLAGSATQVIAMDRDNEVIAHARRIYGAANLLFVSGDLGAPETIPEGPFDLIVAMHVLDHLQEPAVATAALAARLADAGGVYVATQNRLRLTDAGHASNPFLRHELDAADLEALLRRDFEQVAMWGLVHTGELLAAEEQTGGLLPAALVDAAVAGTQPPIWAQALVPSVTTDDFAFVNEPGEISGAFDLIALARAPILSTD